ncbi:ergot alkaloid biosynthesis protein [Actinokineospora sp. PR83]|uniref:ergot alkaloid biosynthesis protein n=1 Tax=Actinokineospora sp. PR83 TaxID=2884908 RepID=UPI001F3B8DDD|nr:ergot alkaloid biosynthesis protein [Actinokineospora sp. PR83]MCG8919163.1 ergot alkaloid biosynthesis protein [Actinokineospora sp. PR83]
MSTPSTVLVIGGTGTTGSRVVALLREQSAAVRIGTRKPDDPGQVRFDWSERATHGPAVAGAERVYLLPPVGVAEPAPLVEGFLAEAARAGVRRVVLLSSSAVPDADSGPGALPPLVRAAVPEWAVLRPSWFMQNFLGSHPVAAGIREHGEIVTATGSGRVGFVDAADIAAVAARALLDPVPHNTDHLITGPEALSYADTAAIITETTGRAVEHRAVSATEMATRFTDTGMSPQFATILADLDTAIRHGAEDRVTSTVRDLTGHPARSFRDFVAANRDAFTA